MEVSYLVLDTPLRIYCGSQQAEHWKACSRLPALLIAMMYDAMQAQLIHHSLWEILPTRKLPAANKVYKAMVRTQSFVKPGILPCSSAIAKITCPKYYLILCESWLLRKCIFCILFLTHHMLIYCGSQPWAARRAFFFPPSLLIAMMYSQYKYSLYIIHYEKFCQRASMHGSEQGICVNSAN